MTNITSGDSFSGLSFSCALFWQNVSFVGFYFLYFSNVYLGHFFLGGELAFVLRCTHLKIHALSIILQEVSWLGF